MNCREFINEFEERGELSSVAQVHLNDCPGCRKTTIVQTHIWKAIKGLPAIDAPANFDFRVKARIADGAPANGWRPTFLPVLRYVLPLAAIVLTLGLLAFNTNFFFGDTAPQVATALPPTPVTAENPPSILPSPGSVAVNGNLAQPSPSQSYAITVANRSEQAPVLRPEPRFAAVKSERKPSRAFRREIFKDNSSDGAGSQDHTYTERKALMPEGIPSGQTEMRTSVGNAPTAKIEDIWSFVGIKIASENGANTIKAVEPNSIAARNGIIVGDVIEAVNGTKLSAQPLNSAIIEIKTLKIRRGAEQLEIAFKN